MQVSPGAYRVLKTKHCEKKRMGLPGQFASTAAALVTPQQNKHTNNIVKKNRWACLVN